MIVTYSGEVLTPRNYSVYICYFLTCRLWTQAFKLLITKVLWKSQDRWRKFKEGQWKVGGCSNDGC